MKPKSNAQQMRKAAVLCCLLLCSVLLGGCWDRREVNDVAFVMGTGLDKEGDQYRVTMQIALPGQLGSSGSTGGGEVPVVRNPTIWSPKQVQAFEEQVPRNSAEFREH